MGGRRKIRGTTIGRRPEPNHPTIPHASSRPKPFRMTAWDDQMREYHWAGTGGGVRRGATMYVCMHAYMDVCLSVCLSVSLSLCLSVSLSLCLSVSLSVCLSVCLPACLPACLPGCLSVCLSVCLSITTYCMRTDKLSAAVTSSRPSKQRRQSNKQILRTTCSSDRTAHEA